MKKYSKYLTVITLALLLGVVSSCTKEDGIFKEDGSNSIVELSDYPSRTSAIANLVLTKSFIATTSVEVPINLNITGVDGAKEDVVVNWDFNDAQVAAVSPAAPANPYIIINQTAGLLVENPVKSITIPKGQKSAKIIIKMNLSAFDFARTYAMGIKLTSASNATVSGNYGNGVFIISPKNAYDGIYSVTAGSIQRYSNPTTPTTGDALNGSLAANADMNLVTINATQCQVTNLRWGNNTAVGGIDNLILTLNPTTNAVTMSSTTAGVTLANTSGRTNSYDPATKTFTLNFDWNQNSTKREVVGLVLKYKASR